MNITSPETVKISRTNVDVLKIGSVITLLVSASALIVGALSLSLNSLEDKAFALLFLLSGGLLGIYYAAQRDYPERKNIIVVYAIVALVSGIILMFIPQYLQGLNFNGIMHRSLISALLLIALAVPAACYSLFYLLGATPGAYDVSRYPILIFPISLVVVAYGLILYKVIAQGATQLDWNVLTTPYAWQVWREQVWQDGWPNWVSHTILQGGMQNHILGTFMLIGLTALISLPVGVGVGVFVHEYSGKGTTAVVKFTTTALRSISGIILAITALSLVRQYIGLGQENFLTQIICGHYYDPNGVWHPARGSFLLAAGLVSLLVIPLIARATEEGLNSLPRDIWEGSMALGVSREHTIIHILLPWSIPNIITGLVLGCAEAAGSLTIILFIAGTGEYGVNPLNGVTSLADFIFDCKYGVSLGNQIPKLVGSYQFTAAFLLLIITLGLTIVALVLKKKFSRRYRGA